MPAHSPRRLVLALLVAIWLVPRARVVRAQDFQLVAVGRGAGGVTTECVTAGPDHVLQSTAAGDDTVSGNVIQTGANGICETPLSGDDVRPGSGVTLGKGLPNGQIILSGLSDSESGICDDTIVAQGDDVVRIPPGQSEPRTIEITVGANLAIDSTPAGDDQLTGAICPGSNGQFETTPDPADVLAANDGRCPILCVSTFLTCILPGNDGLLQTTPSGDDVLAPFISTGANGVAETTAAGDDSQLILPGKGTPRTACVSAGPDGIAQTTVCGNGISDINENGLAGAQCDFAIDPACSAICQPEVCGNGIVDPGEQCDDGNTSNDDACVLGCLNATCGDGYVERGVEECEPPNTTHCDAACQRITPAGCGNGQLDPGEECDDGNTSTEDNCTSNCTIAVCGDGSVHSKGTGPFEECDDGNLQSGDGCSATCTRECGNGVIDGACAQGTVGAPCNTDAQCDSPPSSANGVCIHEECDPGTALLCAPGPSVCSNACLFKACGNGVQECEEACDLGPANGVPGSGCSATCTRLLPPQELRASECLAAFTVDAAPDLKKSSQICHDGAACDFDQIAGRCTFHIGVCLNRSGVPGCTPGNIQTFELTKVNLAHPDEAAAAEAITAAVLQLAPGTATAPDRCRKGAKRKICSIPANQECDSALGAGNGLCDIGSGVVFSPPLDSSTQVSPCTEAVDVVVPVGERLRLSARVRRAGGAPAPARDNDALHLSCRAP